jgi:hypothetical protein
MMEGDDKTDNKESVSPDTISRMKTSTLKKQLGITNTEKSNGLTEIEKEKKCLIIDNIMSEVIMKRQAK